MTVKLFPHGHATHPDWGVAAGLVIAQLRAQMRLPDYAAEPPLGLIYLTDALAPHAQDVLDLLSAELLQVTDWSGCVGVGILAGEAEYIDEPALAVMLCDLPASDYRVFSGVSPLPAQFAASTMLVHADGQAPDLAELVAELAERTRSRAIYGGVVGSRLRPVQLAWSSHGQIPGLASPERAAFDGGLSGVALTPAVAWQARLAQGCRPIGPRRTITEVQGQVITRLDGEPALALLLRDGALPPDTSPQARAEWLALLRRTLVSLEPGSGDADGDPLQAQSRAIVGVDVAAQGLALASGGVSLAPGMAATFCARDVATARRDLVRAATELRAAFEPASLSSGQAHALADDDWRSLPGPGGGIAGAVYFSCVSRTGAYFGGPQAELQIVRRALGRVPLVGVFTAGEIAGRQLHAYAGTLLAFGSSA